MPLSNVNPQMQIVGGGLVGSLLAINLAKKGYQVDVFERRPDMRVEKISAGRSINLAISVRGLTALEKVGLKEKVLKICIPMRGRAVHSPAGEVQIQPYGAEHECIYSVSRSELNKILMDEAEKLKGVKFHFNCKLEKVDFNKNKITFSDDEKNLEMLFGTDGSASVVRETLAENYHSQTSNDILTHSYKELVIPAGSGLTQNALHIWPRKQFMLIALANLDGSFTATLFLSQKGEFSFEKITTEAELHQFFKTHFSDVYSMLPNLSDEFFKNPTGQMVTVKTDHWSFDDKCLILGDAAHAIVPFFGQGMNCGFEDCAVLSQMIDEASKPVNWKEIFNDFYNKRKANTDAIAHLAHENFIEMRDKVADPQFVFNKSVERVLMKNFSEDYVSRYQLVSFSNIEYRKAYEIGLIQDDVLKELCKNLKSPDEVDLSLAKTLIQNKIKPLLKEYYGFKN